MKILQGDLIKAALEGQFDVIAHGANCFCTMGAGIAKQIKNTFPEAYAADLRTQKGDETKLGSWSSARIGSLEVLNCYTQYYYGFLFGVPPVDYVAIKKCMQWIKTLYSGKRIGMPMIGCGLAGGDWAIVSTIIEEELNGEDVTIMYL